MSNLTGAATRVVEVLSDFTPEERLRIVKASLTLLGDELGPVGTKSQESLEPDRSLDGVDWTSTGIHSLAQAWVKKYEITSAQLLHHFHFDNGKVIPIELPGSATSKREQTINAYLAVGLASLLGTGDASFTDAAAREFCTRSGCYDGANHSKTMRAFGNRITGSKSVGWKLTAPGLGAAADLIKQFKG